MGVPSFVPFPPPFPLPLTAVAAAAALHAAGGSMAVVPANAQRQH